MSSNPTDLDDDASTTKGNGFGKIHPLMPPEQKRALWEHVQSIWTLPADDLLKEVKASRDEWGK